MINFGQPLEQCGRELTNAGSRNVGDVRVDADSDHGDLVTMARMVARSTTFKATTATP
jgi:hypothetical protein